MSWFFSDYLQALLLKKEWTVSKLAKKAGLSHVYMNQLLRGVKTENNKTTRISIDTVTALAKALEIPEYNLMLAYKGINPDLIGHSVPFESSLLNEIHTFSIEKGVNLLILAPEARGKIEANILRKTRKIMVILLQDELEQLGIITKES